MIDILHSILPHLPTASLAISFIVGHCDVPCGIYDPKPAQIAAQTVQVMVNKINALPVEADRDVDSQANFVRMVETKEEHAQICKKELLILWTDYFKPEHLALFPDLHTTFWKAAKLCSENKQHVSKDSADELVKVVNNISDMFYKTKTA